MVLKILREIKIDFISPMKMNCTYNVKRQAIYPFVQQYVRKYECNSGAKLNSCQ